MEAAIEEALSPHCLIVGCMCWAGGGGNQLSTAGLRSCDAQLETFLQGPRFAAKICRILEVEIKFKRVCLKSACELINQLDLSTC